MTRLIAGFDLTDPYANNPRTIDVALLDVDDFNVEFLPLNWNGFGDDHQARSEFADATCGTFGSATIWVVDGPVGLAMREQQRREVERLLGAPGRTPWNLPEPRVKPFAGYVRGSVQFHRALFETQHVSFVGMADMAGSCPIQLLEAYPGAAWPKLAGRRLPSKSTSAGIAARKHLLEDCGLRFSTTRLTHDHLDATLCAYLGYLWSQDSNKVQLVGQPVQLDQGHLREGQIVQPIGAAPNWPREGYALPPRLPQQPRLSPQVAAAPPRDRQPPPLGLPEHDWVYFAGSAGAGGVETIELATNEGVIHRTLFANVPHVQAIANVAQMQPGHTLLLCYGDRAVASCRIDLPEHAVAFEGHRFPAFEAMPADGELATRLTDYGYPRDPRIHQHTVLCVDAEPIEEVLVTRPAGQNAIWRWDRVFE